MKKIHQLTESEYKELEQLATLNEDAINKKARELYENEGVHEIRVRLAIDSDYENTLRLKTSAYYSDWQSKYPISRKDAKKVVSFIEDRCYELADKKLGEPLELINRYNEKIRDLNKTKSIFLIVTVLGWSVAILMLLIALK